MAEVIKDKEIELLFNAITIIAKDIIAKDIIGRISNILSLYLSKTAYKLIGNSLLFCYIYIIFVCITAFFLAI